MKYFPKTAYWRPLVTNSEIVDKITNQYFRNTHVPSVAENKAEFVLFFSNKYGLVSLCSHDACWH